MLTKQPNLIAMFGADMEEKNGEAFLQAKKQGYGILALDARAIGIAADSGVNYTLIDDWVGSTSMLRAKKKAMKCEREWFRAVKDIVTSEGVCWPEFDHHAMHWFWLDAMLAFELASALRKWGVREVSFLRHSPRRPMVYYSASDVYSTVLEVELDGVACPHETSRKGSPNHPKPLMTHVLSFMGRGRNVLKTARRLAYEKAATGKSDDLHLLPQSAQAGLKDKIVLVFNPSEFHRFTPIVSHLRGALPGKIAGVITTPDRNLAERFAAEWSVDVFCSPSASLVDTIGKKQFQEGYQKACEASVGEPWQRPLRDLEFHFDYYATIRWPDLVSKLRAWSELWRVSCPKAVLVSSLQDSESQLPAEAANRLGISSYSIPHGAGTTRCWDQVAAENILYSFLTQKTVLERSGIASRRLVPCSGVLVENEYSMNPTNVRGRPEAWRVLGLTNPIGFGGCITPAISPSAQLLALRALDSPPSDIANRLLLTIKVHPKYQDVEMIRAAGRSLGKKVLPPNSDLKTLLQRVDLVVAVNYCGSAVVHTLRAGMPIVYFWTDSLIGLREPYTYADLFLPGGNIARDPERLWGIVREFFTSHGFAERMRCKARRFWMSNLDDGKYLSIGEILDPVVSMQTDSRHCVDAS